MALYNQGSSRKCPLSEKEHALEVLTYEIAWTRYHNLAEGETAFGDAETVEEVS